MVSLVLAAILLCDPCNQLEHSVAPVMSFDVNDKQDVSHLRMYCRTVGGGGWVPVGDVYPRRTEATNGLWRIWPGEDAFPSMLDEGIPYFAPGTVVECNASAIGFNGAESTLAAVAMNCNDNPDIVGRTLYDMNGAPLVALCNWVCWPWTWEVGEEEYVCPCP